MMPMTTTAQTYQALWKQVEQAQQKDLPKTAIQHLQQIETKAGKEKAYGQLLKSTLMHAQLLAQTAPDSLLPAVNRLEQQEKQATSVALRSVYDAVLAQIYQDNSHLSDDHMERSALFREKALSSPDALAQVKAEMYIPFVVSGSDSELYDNDLLSVVGEELEAWSLLNTYYNKVGNRRAACLTALKMIDSIEQADSLIELYGDLPEAGEVAIKRYYLMDKQSADNDDSKANALAKEKYDWLQQSLKRWGTWKRSNELRNALSNLVNPQFSVEVPHQVAMPQEQQTVLLNNLRSLNSITMRVWRTKLNGETQLNPDDSDDLRQIMKGAVEQTAMSHTVTFPSYDEYHVFNDSTELGGLPAGVYLVEFTSEPKTETIRRLYFVSGVRLLMQSQPDNTKRYEVVDARTGHPLKNGKTKTLKKRYYEQLFAYTDTDDYLPGMDDRGRYSYYEREYKSEHTSLFADRSIYRPGQTVNITAIVWKEQSATDNVTICDKHLRMVLRDANYKVVSEQNVVTDKYGKAAAQFTLPKGLLNGRFTVSTNTSSVSFSVEEYKRPTFQVEFDEYKESYKGGDTVRARGRAMTYAGVPVQGAKVHYTVKRRVAWWWMSYSWYWQGGYFGRSLDETPLCDGDAVTDDEGYFLIEMPMLLPDDLGNARMYYSFVADADVTDVAGETHAAQLMLPLGTRPTALTCDLPQKIRKDQMPQVTFSRRNAAGKEIEGKVKYRLDGGKWQQTAANLQFSIFNSQLKSGSHSLEAVCEQDTIDINFVVFGLDDKRPAASTHDWFYASASEFSADGSPVTVQVGSSDPDLYIFYSIFSGDKLIEGGHVEKNGELINRKLTYKEEYGNGLLVTYAWVKDGVCYNHQHTIRRPMPDKRLTMTWETFRDRLTPGQNEEWRLKITKPDGTPADASVMAVLYDKSLDQIRQHQWSFSPSNYLPLPSTYWQWTDWWKMTGYASKQYKSLSVKNLVFSHFDHDVYPSYFSVYSLGTRNVRIRGRKVMSAPNASYAAVANDEVMMAKSVGSYLAEEESAAADVDDQSVGDAPEQKSGEVQIRENLNETAFCYPQLTTDEKGQVSMKFTLPESLTTWRFMGIANSADMLYGYLGGETVARKDVMVQPNMPRFVRVGDEAQIAVRISNTSEHAVCGETRLVLTAPETDKVVYQQSQPLSVEAGKTGTADFRFSISDYRHSLLVCKVVAVGDGFSDGEQHYLPVLPDVEYVTKTVPYTQHEPGVKTIDLTTLFPAGTTQQKLTIEYTNNPAWLMVQSLATVGQPWEHSAIDQAASYYSNLLAKSLLAKSPQVKTVFEQWKHEEQTSHLSSLHSSLSKNQELKDLVLSETPWVNAADREEEQKQRLADFFDENGINNRLSTTIEKLKKLQNSDGSFSWYPGMQGSTYITVAVEEMLVRLNVMTGQQNDTKQMQDKAFKYIGTEMVDVVKELKKQEKKGYKPTFPSFTALHWLYLCALDGRQLSASVQAANDYLIALLKKDIKRQTIYEKALTAIVLSKQGESKKAAEYVQSLKEYTVYTEEMGRYYDTPRAAYSWYDYKIPTEVAAIEALQTVAPKDVQTIDEMRRWLLQEKRTQAWETPINSVNAIWAFLNGNQSLLATKEQTVLAIDGTPVDLPKATAGLGYVKTAIQEPKGTTFTATKTSEGTSWGAVYAQFFQKTSEVEQSSSGITVKREILLPNTTAAANYSLFTIHSSLKCGDRIKVRITIDCTRDLDFVQISDRRAACMEPVRQLSGYHNGAYVSPKDCVTNYFYSGLSKGRHVIETEYYIDRAGQYETGTCSVQCAYAPEYHALAPSVTLTVKK